MRSVVNIKILLKDPLSSAASKCKMVLNYSKLPQLYYILCSGVYHWVRKINSRV